jgi:hypothetical protein
LALGARIGNSWYITVCLEGLAAVAAVEGDHALAVRLYGAVETLATSGDVTLPARDRVFNARYLALARAALNDQTFEAAWAAGRVWALDDAIAEALSDFDLEEPGRP